MRINTFASNLNNSSLGMLFLSLGLGLALGLPAFTTTVPLGSGSSIPADDVTSVAPALPGALR